MISVLLLLSWALLGLAPSAQAFTPYRLIFGAAKSPESVTVFARDKRLKSQLKRALVVAVPEATLAVSSYVVGGHAYLVGWVDSAQERSELEEAAINMGGLQSVDVYLPIKKTGDEAPSSVDEMKLKTSVLASLVEALGTDRTNVSVDVLGTHVVLVGVLASADEVHSARAAAEGTHGVSGVTSYLSVPPVEDRKLLGRLLP